MQAKENTYQENKYLCCYHDDFSVMEESFRITRTIFFLLSNPVDTILRITIEVGGNDFCLIDTFLVKMSYLS